jgi:hypothetical protein
MAKYKPLLTPFYYDETKFDSYLDQLGVTYPTVKELGLGSGVWGLGSGVTVNP